MDILTKAEIHDLERFVKDTENDRKVETQLQTWDIVQCSNPACRRKISMLTARWSSGLPFCSKGC